MEYFWKKKTIVSFILSLFVVLWHNTAIDQYYIQLDISNTNITLLFFILRETFVRLAIPLFFILSGFTFFRNYEKTMFIKKIKSRFGSLFVPYILWNTVGMLFYIICSYTPIKNYFINRQAFEISIRNIFEAIFYYKCNMVFWFIAYLLIFIALTPLFDIITSKKSIVFVVLIGQSHEIFCQFIKRYMFLLTVMVLVSITNTMTAYITVPKINTFISR